MISGDQIIYLANNATTQLDPAVIEEMLPYLTEYYGNPSSGYTFGAQVRRAIDLARERVAALLGCEPGEIVFTSCGTEANNAALNSALQLDPARQHVVTTAVEHSAAFRPSLIGGSQENNRRAGTENVASIVALGKAAECAMGALADEETRVRALRDRFETSVLETVPGSSVNGGRAARLPNTTNLSFAGIQADAALMLLDRERICCSAGSACRTGSLESSRVLRAMKVSDENARGSMRFSFGRFNAEAEVDKAVEILAHVIAKMRALSPAARAPETAAA